MQDVYLMCNDGVGGNLLTASVASIVKKAGENPIILCPSRDEVFKPFKYLLEDQFEVLQAPENQVELLFNFGPKSIGIVNKEEIYAIYPDGLYLNPYHFNYKRYNTSPQVIKSLRVLTHKFKPVDKNIYIGLISSTDGYLYYNIQDLTVALAKKLPDYTIHLPVVDKWAGKDIKMGDLVNLPENVRIYKNDSFINQIDIMSKCEYGIYTDNGFSHISYNLGQQRLLIDPRFGYGRESLMWRARWRQTDDDSIRFNSLPEDIADLVYINLKTPQTTLIPKQVVLNNKHADWSRELLFKY